jgi:hypothetical protein
MRPFHIARGVRLALGAVLAVMVASCSAPAGPNIDIMDGEWSATPSSVEAGGGEFTLTVANETATTQTFAVVYLWRGSPDSLPTVDGLLDLSRNRLTGDAENPGVALFSVVYPEYESPEGEGVEPAPLAPASVEPTEEVTFTIGGAKGGGEPGPYVLLSWEPGGYEAGDYAAFEITG